MHYKCTSLFRSEGKEMERLQKEVQHLKEKLASEMKRGKQPFSIEDIKDDPQKVVILDLIRTM